MRKEAAEMEGREELGLSTDAPPAHPLHSLCTSYKLYLKFLST